MKQETLEEAAKEYVNGRCTGGVMEKALLSAIEFGANYQAERMYSEEEVIGLLKTYQSSYSYANNEIGLKKWFEDLKKK